MCVCLFIYLFNKLMFFDLNFVQILTKIIGSDSIRSSLGRSAFGPAAWPLEFRQEILTFDSFMAWHQILCLKIPFFMEKIEKLRGEPPRRKTRKVSNEGEG